MTFIRKDDNRPVQERITELLELQDAETARANHSELKTCANCRFFQWSIAAGNGYEAGDCYRYPKVEKSKRHQEYCGEWASDPMQSILKATEKK